MHLLYSAQEDKEVIMIFKYSSVLIHYFYYQQQQQQKAHKQKTGKCISLCLVTLCSVLDDVSALLQLCVIESTDVTLRLSLTQSLLIL